MDYRAKNRIENAIKKWVTDKLNKKATDIDFDDLVNNIVHKIIVNDSFVIFRGFKICKN